MRIILAALFICLANQSFAQAPDQTTVQPRPENIPNKAILKGDAAALSFISYDAKGDQAIEARTGIPPLKIGKTMLINALSYRHTNLSSDKVPASEDLKLSDYGFTTMFIAPVNDWTVMTRVGVNFANAQSDLKIQKESTFYNSVIAASRQFQNNNAWKYNLGVVFLGRGARIPVVPVIGFEYESEGQIYQLQIGFPTIQGSYGVSSWFRVGLFSAFTSGSYFIEENSALRQDGEYVGVDRIVLGVLTRTRLARYLWLNSRVGYSVYGKTAVYGGDFKERKQLDEESGVYFLMGLGLTVPGR
jgi:hypothetical protein